MTTEEKTPNNDIQKIPSAFVNTRKALCFGCSCDVNFEDPCAICPKGRWYKIFCDNFENTNSHVVPIITPEDFEGFETDDKEQFLEKMKDLTVDKNKIVVQTHKVPPTAVMVKSAMKSAKNWLLSGFKHTDPETLETRIDLCKKCEFWNQEGFNGTGRCMKCGCSTWAKLRMATEKCPIGKW